MFGIKTKVEQGNTPDMSGIRPGSPEERERYEQWKAAKALGSASTSDARIEALKSVADKTGVVRAVDSQRVGTGEVPVVSDVFDVAHPVEKLPEGDFQKIVNERAQIDPDNIKHVVVTDESVTQTVHVDHIE